MPTVRDAAFAVFHHFGVDAIFGNPGSTELPMLRDLPPAMRYVLGLQESVVVGMADGYAQATRRPALVNLHSAAGVGHAMGNIFTAWKNQTPLVITAGQQARAILPFDPFLYAERATELPQPYVKWSIEPACAQNVPSALARAFHIAMTPPCGPTFVSIPVDDWDRDSSGPPPLATLAHARAADPHAVATLTRALDAAARPALVLGAGVARADGWDAAIALAERAGVRVHVAPFSARAVFPETHALFGGFLPPLREAIAARLTGHDVILIVGSPVFPYHVEGAGPHWPEDAACYLVSDDAQHCAAMPGGQAFLADCGATLAALARSVAQRQWPDGARIARAPPPRTMSAAWLLHRVAALRPADSIIVEEAPSSRGAMHDHLPILRKDGFYTCASGGLGHGLPAAIGVALGRADARTIAILGDGAAMYAIQGLHAAARLAAPVSILILNNRRYQALVEFGRHFGLQRVEGADLDGLDFVRLAEGQGVPAARVAKTEALDDALAACFASKGPSLLEIVID